MPWYNERTGLDTPHNKSPDNKSPADCRRLVQDNYVWGGEEYRLRKAHTFSDTVVSGVWYKLLYLEV